MSSVQVHAHHGAKPPKEMRTVRRDGDIFTEDYERVNPDGTVTKTITVTDQKTGQKQVTVYKMDKSGIVRKLDEADYNKMLAEEGVKNEALVQKLKDQLAETKEKLQAVKEMKERSDSKSVVYENRDGYNRRIEEEYPDKLEMAYNVRNINKPIELTPKQQAILREHKENIFNYGTQKLIKQLNKKLNEDKFNNLHSLTDREKDKVIEYGIRKLHKLLEKNLDEERLIYDVMSFNPDFGKVDLSGRGTRQIPGDQSVSFSLNPYKDMSPEEYAKPVSFSMRPEKPSKPLLEPGSKREGNNSKSEPFDRQLSYNAIMDHLTKKYREQLGATDDTDTTTIDRQQDNELVDAYESNDYHKLRTTVKKLVEEDKLYKQSTLSPDEKEEIINYAVNQVRSILKNTADPEKERARKKKINVYDYFEEDEIFDYGKKVLKKLIKRSLKGFGLTQDIIRQRKIDDPELSKRRDQFFQYLSDVIEGTVKESDPLPIEDETPELEEKTKAPKFDYKNLLSSIFGGNYKDKTENSEDIKTGQKKRKDMDDLLSWFDDDEEDKIKMKKVSSQPNENAPTVKPRFYQLESHADSKDEQNQAANENKGFDLKALLKKIQDAAVKRFSDNKPAESVEKQEHAQINVNNNPNSNERESKQAQADAALSGVRQNNNETSNSRRITGTNKPPYLKERISGLDTIPRPTITTVSSTGRNREYSDQVSFQLKPHNYENTNKQEERPRSLENQKIETGKSCSHEQDFQPWWFESPESFVKKALTEKPLIKEGFMGSPILNSSSGFSAGGRFNPGNLLE